MKKTCLLCAFEFEAKRSDAQYCSEKCRTKANYQIRKKKKVLTASPDIYEDNSPFNLTDKSSGSAQISVKGSLSMEEIMQTISKCEQEMAHTMESKHALNAHNDQLNMQTLEFQCQIADIEENKIKKLELIMNQSDINLYNRFLNDEYLNAIKSGNSFAKNKLKIENDLEGYSSISIRKSIADYRLKIQNQIISLQASAESLRIQLESAKSMILKNAETIKELDQQIRFFQTRIIRFEKLLTG